MRLAHNHTVQTSYASNLYTGSVQTSNRISMPYQTSTNNMYYNMNVAQQQHHQQQLMGEHSPKVECPSPPNATRSPVLVSARHSPEHHQMTSPHIVSLGNSSPTTCWSKLPLSENNHHERGNIVSSITS